MRILTFYVCMIFTWHALAQTPSNCKLLKPGKIIAQNNITKLSLPENQFVLSILETNPPNTSSDISKHNHPQWTSEQIGNITKAVYDEEGNM